MKSVLMALVVGLLTSGCAGVVTRTVVTQIEPDLSAAKQVLDASRDLLPADDAWGPCVGAILQLASMLKAGPGLSVSGGGLITEAARLHVLDTSIKNLPPLMKQACGEAALEILVRAGSRLPGL